MESYADVTWTTVGKGFVRVTDSISARRNNPMKQVFRDELPPALAQTLSDSRFAKIDFSNKFKPVVTAAGNDSIQVDSESTVGELYRLDVRDA